MTPPSKTKIIDRNNRINKTAENDVLDYLYSRRGRDRVLPERIYEDQYNDFNPLDTLTLERLDYLCSQNNLEKPKVNPKYSENYLKLNHDKSITCVLPQRVATQVYNMEETGKYPSVNKTAKKSVKKTGNSERTESPQYAKDNELPSSVGHVCSKSCKCAKKERSITGKALMCTNNADALPSIILKRKGSYAREYKFDQMDCALRNMKCPLLIKFHGPSQLKPTHGGRDYDRDRNKERDGDRVKDKSRDVDKDKIKSRDGEDRIKSRDKDRDRIRSSRDKEKEMGKDGGRDKDSEKDKGRDGERYWDRYRDKRRDGDKDKDRDKNGERDKYKDKDRDGGKYRDKYKDKGRDGEKDDGRNKDQDRDRDGKKIKSRGKDKDRDRDFSPSFDKQLQEAQGRFTQMIKEVDEDKVRPEQMPYKRLKKKKPEQDGEEKEIQEMAKVLALLKDQINDCQCKIKEKSQIPSKDYVLGPDGKPIKLTPEQMRALQKLLSDPSIFTPLYTSDRPGGEAIKLTPKQVSDMEKLLSDPASFLPPYTSVTPDGKAIKLTPEQVRALERLFSDPSTFVPPYALVKPDDEPIKLTPESVRTLEKLARPDDEANKLTPEQVRALQKLLTDPSPLIPPYSSFRPGEEPNELTPEQVLAMETLLSDPASFVPPYTSVRPDGEPIKLTPEQVNALERFFSDPSTFIPAYTSVEPDEDQIKLTPEAVSDLERLARPGDEPIKLTPEQALALQRLLSEPSPYTPFRPDDEQIELTPEQVNAMNSLLSNPSSFVPPYTSIRSDGEPTELTPDQVRALGRFFSDPSTFVAPYRSVKPDDEPIKLTPESVRTLEILATPDDEGNKLTPEQVRALQKLLTDPSPPISPYYTSVTPKSEPVKLTPEQVRDIEKLMSDPSKFISPYTSVRPDGEPIKLTPEQVHDLENLFSDPSTFVPPYTSATPDRESIKLTPESVRDLERLARPDDGAINLTPDQVRALQRLLAGPSSISPFTVRRSLADELDDGEEKISEDLVPVSDKWKKTSLDSKSDTVKQDSDSPNFSAFIIDISLSLDGDEEDGDDSNINKFKNSENVKSKPKNNTEELIGQNSELQRAESEKNQDIVERFEQENTEQRRDGQNVNKERSSIDQNFNKTVYLATNISQQTGFAAPSIFNKQKPPFNFREYKYKKTNPSTKAVAAMRTRPEREDYLECNRIFMVNYLTQQTNIRNIPKSKPKAEKKSEDNALTIDNVLPQIYDKLSNSERIQFLNIMKHLVSNTETIDKTEDTMLERNFGTGDLECTFQLLSNEIQSNLQPKYLVNRSKFSIHRKKGVNKHQNKNKCLTKDLKSQTTSLLRLADRRKSNKHKICLKPFNKSDGSINRNRPENYNFSKLVTERNYNQHFRDLDVFFNEIDLNSKMVTKNVKNHLDADDTYTNNYIFPLKTTKRDKTRCTQLSNDNYEQFLHESLSKLQKHSAEQNRPCTYMGVEPKKSVVFNILGTYKHVKPCKQTNCLLKRPLNLENDMTRDNNRIKVKVESTNGINKENQLKPKEYINQLQSKCINSKDCFSDTTDTITDCKSLISNNIKSNTGDSNINREIKEKLLPLMKELNSTLRIIMDNLKQCVSKPNISIYSTNSECENFQSNHKENLVQMMKNASEECGFESSQSEINRNKTQDIDDFEKINLKMKTKQILFCDKELTEQTRLQNKTLRNCFTDNNKDIVQYNENKYEHVNEFNNQSNSSILNEFTFKANAINDNIDLTKVNFQTTELMKMSELYKLVISNSVSLMIDGKVGIDEIKCLPSSYTEFSELHRNDTSFSSYSSPSSESYGSISQTSNRLCIENPTHNDITEVKNDKNLLHYKNETETSKFKRFFKKIVPCIFKKQKKNVIEI